MSRKLVRIRLRNGGVSCGGSHSKSVSGREWGFAVAWSLKLNEPCVLDRPL